MEEEKIEKGDKSVDNKLTKKEKVAKILFIMGIVTFVIFLILFVFWAALNISNMDDENLGKAVGILVGFVYFGIPSLVFGAITTALTTTSLILSKNRKILKNLILTFSALLLIFDIILFVLI